MSKKVTKVKRTRMTVINHLSEGHRFSLARPLVTFAKGNPHAELEQLDCGRTISANLP